MSQVDGRYWKSLQPFFVTDHLTPNPAIHFLEYKNGVRDNFCCVYFLVSVINDRGLTATFAHRKTNCTVAKYRNYLLGFSLGEMRDHFVEHYIIHNPSMLFSCS